MATKNSWKLTTKPTKKSTLTGTDTTRGGGPDSGNIGYNKDMIYRHGKHRKKWREEMEKRKKKPEGMLKPYRAKHGIGSLVKGAKKIIDKATKPSGVFKPKGVTDKKINSTLKKLGDEIKAAPLPPQLKKLVPKLKKAFPHHDPAGKLKKAKGGRIGYQSGGRTNLLEELGRVEAEPSNRNRRAEISRVHGELNRGYKSGGAVLKGKKVGIQIK